MGGEQIADQQGADIRRNGSPISSGLFEPGN